MSDIFDQLGQQGIEVKYEIEPQERELTEAQHAAELIGRMRHVLSHMKDNEQKGQMMMHVKDMHHLLFG